MILNLQPLTNIFIAHCVLMREKMSGSTKGQNRLQEEEILERGIGLLKKINSHITPISFDFNNVYLTFLHFVNN